MNNDMVLEGKRILLGVSGSIAAYKAIELARLLCQQNATVKTVLTEGAKQFITPLSFSAITNQSVHQSLFDPAKSPMVHISLAKWADAVVIAPASASLISRLAHGDANDLLSTLFLATDKPCFLAPAMNQQMWHHPITQENINKLHQFCHMIGPASGEQACGDFGYGRMSEPEAIIQAIANFFQPRFVGKKILITAGATHEPIDPVRYLGNYSSGKMGFALAKELEQQGADVTLIAGMTSVTPPNVHHFISAPTAEAMYNAVMDNIKHCDVFIAAAAVADYRPHEIAAQKIKKEEPTLHLALVKNPDILADVGKLKNKPYIIGFAAETENLIENAKAKLISKKADMIIANLVKNNFPFGADENTVVLLTHDAEPIELPRESKQQLAKKICDVLCDTLRF